jgi:hypothetical protein
MFDDIEGEIHATISIHTFPDNQSTLEDLLRAVEISCYICLNIYDQLDGECAIDQLGTDSNVPLLLRKACKDMFTGELHAMIGTNPQLESIRAYTWPYMLVAASRHQEQFGFDFARSSADPTRAIHQMYQDIPSSTNSPIVGALARSWYQCCKLEHTNCTRSDSWDTLDLRNVAAYGSDVYPHTVVDSPRKLLWYPPRLLDVYSSPPRLVLRADVQNGEPYAALSHCWGKEKFLALSDSNIKVYQDDGIQPATMPENFRNVTDICRWLHIRYVWIDSLCILQTGQGSRVDWKQHLVLMSMIYANSDLCISTAATDRATKSCFRERNKAAIAPVFVRYRGEPHLVISSDFSFRGFRSAPIAFRAWTLQERLLSHRILSFGAKQIFWECRHTEKMSVSETFPQGLPAFSYLRRPFSMPDVPSETLSPWNFGKLHEKWSDLIEIYCSCKLTQSHHDKLAAFSGIARHMYAVLGKSPYVAGFFEFELPGALLWQVSDIKSAASRPTPPSGFYRAPSWSWASTDVLLKMHKRHTIPVARSYFTRVTSYHVEPVDPNNTFGQLLDAKLLLRGALIPLARTHKTTTLGEENSSEGAMYTLSQVQLQNTCIRISFDSRTDANSQMDDVCFLPILGYSGIQSVLGIVVRPFFPSQYQGVGTDTMTANAALDDTLRCYMRVGTARLLGEGYFSKMEELEKRVIVLV